MYQHARRPLYYIDDVNYNANNKNNFNLYQPTVSSSMSQANVASNCTPSLIEQFEEFQRWKQQQKAVAARALHLTNEQTHSCHGLSRSIDGLSILCTF
jgi:hypothetical protein